MKIGFEMDGIDIPIESILPVRSISLSVKKSPKYTRIKSSIQEVGIIEPPIVFPINNGNKPPRQFLLLDGHLRIDILRGLDQKTVYCLISTDDEAYTYNHKVNQLAPIQEHFMILKAIDKGVGEARLAKALNVDVGVIRRKRNMLEGICPEVVELLKDKQICQDALYLMRKVKPIRQIEMAELMNSVKNYSKTYAKALLVATKKELFLDAGQTKQKIGIDPDAMAQMEKEMEAVEHDFMQIEKSYGKNVMHLLLARGYLDNLLRNGRVVRFLSTHYGDTLVEFQKIVDSVTEDS
jgi:ParB-like chromosome segregation protein Spo0J